MIYIYQSSMLNYFGKFSTLLTKFAAHLCIFIFTYVFYSFMYVFTKLKSKYVFTNSLTFVLFLNYYYEINKNNLTFE